MLASAYANEENVVIAKIDCDAHKDTCAQYDVSGYPTLKWFPKVHNIPLRQVLIWFKTDKSGVRYESGRDVESFITYINNAAGTFRDKSGSLSEDAGRIEQLDEIVEKFADAEG